MPSRRQRKARAAAGAAANTQGVEVDPDFPFLTDEPIETFIVDYLNTGDHALEAAETACGDAETYSTTYVELIMADFERDVAKGNGFVVDSHMRARVQPRVQAVFDEVWDGQVPELISNHIALAAAATAKIKDSRGAKDTGATGTGGEANSTGVMGTAAAVERQQAKTQVGPSERKPGQRALGLHRGVHPKSPYVVEPDNISGNWDLTTSHTPSGLDWEPDAKST